MQRTNGKYDDPPFTDIILAAVAPNLADLTLKEAADLDKARTTDMMITIKYMKEVALEVQR